LQVGGVYNGMVMIQVIAVDPDGGYPEARWSAGEGWPMQTFTRWYGYTATFPGGALYAG